MSERVVEIHQSQIVTEIEIAMDIIERFAVNIDRGICTLQRR
ncbi:hypothetical protein [Candidatus Poriferisodalis sp.]